jgi:homoserine kinase
VIRTDSVTAFAPGGVGNVGPGLDILGLALEGDGDTVRAEWTAGAGISIIDPGHPELPRDPDRHTAGLAARAVLERANEPRSRKGGIALTIRKGLPLCGGQGGSAASAVAGAVAVNGLLGNPLDRRALVEPCLAAEERVAGRHADNIAASLFGGIVLIRSLEPFDLIELPVPEELWVVIVRPEQQLRTRDARSVLPAMVSREVALHQAAQVGAMVAALASGDYALLGRSLDDQIAEPARAKLLPGFTEAKEAALKAGALGSSISGAGPSAFALVQGGSSAQRVATVMVQSYTDTGQRSTARIARVDRQGARLMGNSEEAQP